MTSKVIALFVWAPQPISGFYIVKSAMRLINSGNLPIKKPDAVWIYAFERILYPSTGTDRGAISVSSDFQSKLS
jgi:hypothetical protein